MSRRRKLSTVLIGLIAALPLVATPSVAAATEAAVQAKLDRMAAERAAAAPGTTRVCYSVHVQDKDWTPALCDGQEAGFPEQHKRIEAIMISVAGTNGGVGVCYRPHLQDIGWVANESCNNNVAGTVGQSRRLEAIRIRGLGTRLCYTATGQDYEYRDSVCDNEIMVTVGESRYMSGIMIFVA